MPTAPAGAPEAYGVELTRNGVTWTEVLDCKRPIRTVLQSGSYVRLRCGQGMFVDVSFWDLEANRETASAHVQTWATGQRGPAKADLLLGGYRVRLTESRLLRLPDAPGLPLPSLPN